VLAVRGWVVVVLRREALLCCRQRYVYHLNSNNATLVVVVVVLREGGIVVFVHSCDNLNDDNILCWLMREWRLQWYMCQRDDGKWCWSGEAVSQCNALSLK